MKTADNHFHGFPAVWNLVAFYLLLLRPEPWVCMATIVVFAALTFAPVRFVHPIRVKKLRALNVALLALWSVLAIAALWQEFKPNVWIVVALCAIALYFLAVGLMPARERRGN
jgi:phosphatidylcholine synthase